MSRYKLYTSLQTGAACVEAALAEMGVDYEEIMVNRQAGEHNSEAFRLINPRQQIPALALPDGTIMTEAPAMLVHLGDAHPQYKLVPKPGSSARAQHDRWLAYFHANVYEGELRKAFPSRYVTDESAAPAVARAAEIYVERHHLIYEEALGKGPYLFGETFSMIDIYVWMVASWMPQDWLAAHCPKIKRLADSVATRPLIAPVHARHFG